MGAQLGAVSTVYLVRTLTAPPLANATFTAKGADWRYLDTGANLGTPWSVSNPGGWTGFAFNDGAWAHGPAPLGYNNSPAATRRCRPRRGNGTRSLRSFTASSAPRPDTRLPVY